MPPIHLSDFERRTLSTQNIPGGFVCNAGIGSVHISRHTTLMPMGPGINISRRYIHIRGFRVVVLPMEFTQEVFMRTVGKFILFSLLNWKGMLHLKMQSNRLKVRSNIFASIFRTRYWKTMASAITNKQFNSRALILPRKVISLLALSSVLRDDQGCWQNTKNGPSFA